MVHFTYPLDNDYYMRAELFSVYDENIETYAIGFGAPGCLYDSVLDGYETYNEALDALMVILYEDYGIILPVD